MIVIQSLLACVVFLLAGLLVLTWIDSHTRREIADTLAFIAEELGERADESGD